MVMLHQNGEKVRSLNDTTNSGQKPLEATVQDESPIIVFKANRVSNHVHHLKKKSLSVRWSAITTTNVSLHRRLHDWHLDPNPTVKQTRSLPVGQFQVVDIGPVVP